ncbi:hypothetical protein KJ673_04160 [Patescibacteria group bacterium]|nr:hypothetical protein [Patescibacteria group bacterium]MCG2687226.1 hypothetical protein [Candidatus Parcubacteria bacterium]
MIDKDKLAQLIADSAMMDEEKTGWIHLAEFMNEEELQQLMDTLQKEQVDLAVLREEYVQKIAKVVQEEKSE